MPDTFILRVKRGVVRLVSVNDREDADKKAMDGAQERMDGQLSMLRDVARYIPDMSAVWGLHDTPQVMIAYDHRRELQDFYEDGECECFSCPLLPKSSRRSAEVVVPGAWFMP